MLWEDGRVESIWVSRVEAEGRIFMHGGEVFGSRLRAGGRFLFNCLSLFFDGEEVFGVEGGVLKVVTLGFILSTPVSEFLFVAVDIALLPIILLLLLLVGL